MVKKDKTEKSEKRKVRKVNASEREEREQGKEGKRGDEQRRAKERTRGLSSPSVAPPPYSPTTFPLPSSRAFERPNVLKHTTILKKRERAR